MSAVSRWRARPWRIPVLLALLTLVGLLAALIGDGAWNAPSWATLGVPVAFEFWYTCRCG